MNSLVVANIFIVLLHLCILVGLTTASELGISSCRYLGEFEEDGEKCRKDVVKVSKLPDQCSSYVYDGVICRQSYVIEPKNTINGLEVINSLVQNKNMAHRVFLFFSHGGSKDWYDVLFTGNHSIVAKNVRIFNNQRHVKGLILCDIDTPDLVGDGADGFYEKFKAYVTAIKDKNPHLEIGLYLSARYFIEDISYSCWFDFSQMNDFLDFYIFEFATFNECTADFLHGGITPLDSSSSTVMSLNKFADALGKSKVDTKKIFFEFLISPIPKPEEIENFKPCEISYNEYCENEDDNKNKWCADNTDILFTKGAFAQKYGNGFIGRYIDLVDRDDKCGCGKYMAFDAMQRGYNGYAYPETCDKLNG